MRNFTLSLAVVAALFVAREVSAASVETKVTPDNIDHQPLAFAVKVKDVKEGQEFEIAVKPKTGKLPPARFLVPHTAVHALKRVDREGESVVFSLQVSQKDLEGAKFSLSNMGYVEMKDEAGNAKFVAMPSAETYTFFLKDFIRQSERPAPKGPVPPEKPVAVKAVYFVGKQGGELTLDDLKKHPEVKTVQSFADFQRFAEKGRALWIDVTAVPLLLQGEKEREWVIRKAQEEYTFAMVGGNESLWCFRDNLDCFGISGPGPIDWTKYDLSPGFCVIRQSREKVGKETHVSNNGRGYKVTPTVQKILNVTDRLLAGEAAPDAP